MKRVTLQDQETQNLQVIVDKYRNLGEDLESVQEQLKVLDEKKSLLLEVLDNIREEELTFLDSLEKAYGEGKIDPLTLEYVTKQ